MMRDILAAIPHRSLLPNDACQDCVIPVSRGFLNDLRYGAQPIPTLNIPATTASPKIAAPHNSPALPTKLPSETLTPSSGCFPADYEVVVSAGVCAITHKTAGVAPDALLGGGATAYVWFPQYDITGLYGLTPRFVFGVMDWRAAYFDEEGYAAANSGVLHDLIGNQEYIEFEVYPSFTPESETVVIFSNVYGYSVGSMAGYYANIY